MTHLEGIRLGEVAQVGRAVLRRAPSMAADGEGYERAVLSHPYVIMGLEQVRDAECRRRASKDCTGIIDRLFAKDVGTPAQMCVTCANTIAAAREAKPVDDKDGRAFTRQVALVGVPQRIQDALGLRPGEPVASLARAKDGRWNSAGAAVEAFLANPSGLLVLSGSSGVGKSCCAAFAAWRTRGRFFERSEWAALPVRTSRERGEMMHALNAGGVVVLDDALHIRPNGDPGDNDHETEVLFEVAQGRHEAKRPTIITTQSDAREVITAFGTRGEAIVRRARSGHDLSGAPSSGGWVDCVWKRKTGAA